MPQLSVNHCPRSAGCSKAEGTPGAFRGPDQDETSIDTRPGDGHHDRLAGLGIDRVTGALVTVAVVTAIIPVGHLWLANRIKVSARGVDPMTKFGVLLVATIGIQLMLNGSKVYSRSTPDGRLAPPGDPRTEA